MKRKTTKSCVCLLLMIFILDGCNGAENRENGEYTAAETYQEQTEDLNREVSRDIFAMDTYMTVTAYGSTAEQAVDEAVSEIQRLDALLSTGDSDSETAKLNQAGSGILSEDSRYLLSRSMELWQDTDGVFNIAIYPVVQAWGFPTGEYRVPEEEELTELLRLTDMTDIVWDEGAEEISFAKQGMMIDFGGIAKGYTSERLMQIFEANGVTSGLVNLGGNVQAYGKKIDGSCWRVAIQNPELDGSYLGVLQAADEAVITSGGYERYFEQGGVSYHHIIDPSTGYPAESGLTSVSIICSDGTLADGLSTSLFIMGKERAIDYWRNNSESFDMILYGEDGSLMVTEGIKERFSSDYPVEIIREGEKQDE